LKAFIPNRAGLISARVRWGDEERGRVEDEERGDGQSGRISISVLSLLLSPFYLLPSTFYLLPSSF